MLTIQVAGQGGPVEVDWIEITTEVHELRTAGGFLLGKQGGKEWIRAAYTTGYVFLGVKVDFDLQHRVLVARPWTPELDVEFPPEIAARPPQEPGYVYTRTMPAPPIPGSRPSKDGPTVDQAMRSMWLELRNGANEPKLAFVIGALQMAELMGLMTPDQRAGWEARIRECPGHDDEGGRDWCAYGCTKAQMA